MQAPTLDTPRFQSEVGQDDACIGVAVLTFPETCTLLFGNVLVCSLAALLRLNSIPVINTGVGTMDIVGVVLITVHEETRDAAIEVIKTHLAQMELLHCCTVAVSVGNGPWRFVGGLDLGGASFDETFLRRELITKTRAAMEKFERGVTKVWPQVIEKLLRQLPDSPRDSLSE